MRFREPRDNETRQRSDGEADGNLASMRETGESLFEAADAAINKALSQDSLSFLNNTRQQGGQ